MQQFFVIFYDMRYPHDPCSLHQITSRPLIRRNCGSSDSSESSPPTIIPLTSSSHCEATYSFSTRLSDRTSTSSFSLASSWKAETFDSLSAALAGLIRTSCRSWSVVIAFVASSIAVYSLPALNSESVVSALASSRASWTARGVHETGSGLQFGWGRAWLSIRVITWEAGSLSPFICCVLDPSFICQVLDLCRHSTTGPILVGSLGLGLAWDEVLPSPLHRFPMTKYDSTDFLPRIGGNQIRINEGFQNRPLDPWKSKTVVLVLPP